MDKPFKELHSLLEKMIVAARAKDYHKVELLNNDFNRNFKLIPGPYSQDDTALSYDQTRASVITAVRSARSGMDDIYNSELKLAEQRYGDLDSMLANSSRSSEITPRKNLTGIAAAFFLVVGCFYLKFPVTTGNVIVNLGNNSGNVVPLI